MNENQTRCGINVLLRHLVRILVLVLSACGSMGAQCQPPPDIYMCNMTYDLYMETVRSCYKEGFTWADERFCICGVTPIVIDIQDNGYHLTSASNGVFFAPGPGKPLIKMAWTERGSDDAFLVLDRNDNGVIDDASELFGAATPQPDSSSPNGFLALAIFDAPDNGGDGNGVIDARDAVFHSLRLWTDVNHNGISEPDELFELPLAGIQTIGIDFRPARKKDKFGNVAQSKARLIRSDLKLDWAFDILFSTSIAGK